MSTLQDKMATLSPARREKVLACGKELIAEEMTLGELRRALNITQDQVADLLETGQHTVSRLEHRNDMKLSTLDRVVTALGGELKVVASFPDRGDIALRTAVDG